MSQPSFQGIDVTYKSQADNKDIRDLLVKLVPKAKSPRVAPTKKPVKRYLITLKVTLLTLPMGVNKLSNYLPHY
jgi:hypothetical protein